MNRLDQIARRVRKFLGPASQSEEPIFQRVSAAYDRSLYLVRVYYLVSAFLAYELLADMHSAAEQSLPWDFLWPLRWLDWIAAPATMPEVLALALFIASALALQFYNKTIVRVAVAVLCLMVVALTNSQGGINHGYHVWLWVGVCFAFLPETTLSCESRKLKMSYLSVIVAAQALVLFFYTLAGLWKVRYGLVALINGQEGNFAPRGLALQLADRMLVTGTKPLFAELAISNYWLIWPAFIVIIYCQSSAVLTTLRPRLHTVWGYVLISFHLGTWLLMEIPFPVQMLFVGLLFVMSPFQPQLWNYRKALADFPGLNMLLEVPWLTRKGAPPLRQPA